MGVPVLRCLPRLAPALTIRSLFAALTSTCHRPVTNCVNMCTGTGGLSEALALLDFTVLTRARQFVGFGLSSFSWGVQEYRCLLGLPLKSTTMPAISIPAWNAMGLSGVTVLSDHDVACPDAEPAVQV